VGGLRTKAEPRLQSRGAENSGVRRLPPALRAVAAVAERVHVRGQERAGTMARTRLREDVPYETPYGVRLRVDPLDQFERLMALGLFERHVVDMIRRFALPGSTVIDGGAHIGYTAVVAARAVGAGGAVHAFECDPRAVRRLREHVQLNDTSWVTVNEAALDDVSDRRAVLHVPPQVGWASTRGAPAGGWAARLDVRTAALDDYLDRAGVDRASVSLVKLDLEGSELEALRGAPRLLAEGRPALIVEFIPDDSAHGARRADELFELLGAFGYEAFVPVPSRRRKPAPPLARHDGVSRADILFLHPASEAWRLAFS